MPGGATLHGLLENIVGSAVPAFVVTAIVSGRTGVRDLARRSLCWRVQPRWYLITLLAPPAALLVSVTALYGLDPLRTLAQNWPLLLTSFLPTLAVMAVFNSVAEEVGWTSSSPGCKTATGRCAPPWPRPSSSGSTTCQASSSTPGSWQLTAALMGFLLLPHLASRLIVGWLYNAAGASVLIAGLLQPCTTPSSTRPASASPSSACHKWRSSPSSPASSSSQDWPSRQPHEGASATHPPRRDLESQRPVHVPRPAWWRSQEERHYVPTAALVAVEHGSDASVPCADPGT
jgi:hypothetical protein